MFKTYLFLDCPINYVVSFHFTTFHFSGFHFISSHFVLFKFTFQNPYEVQPININLLKIVTQLCNVLVINQYKI
jgi:hypothetical protein